ncbi:MAG: hypothetical protein ACRDMV_00180 [Streptosporangiales bacterium]
MRTLLLAVAVIIGIFVLGSIVIAALKIAFGLLLYLFIGALIVGAVVFVVGKVRGAVGRRG